MDAFNYVCITKERPMWGWHPEDKEQGDQELKYSHIKVAGNKKVNINNHNHFRKSYMLQASANYNPSKSIKKNLIVFL